MSLGTGGELTPRSSRHSMDSGATEMLQYASSSSCSLKRGSDSGISVNSNIVQLRRTVGLFSGMAFILGTIIGSGIFVSPKGVLIESGSVGMSLLVWAICGIIALFGALSFAELGTMITKSGGIYNYIEEAFGDLAAFMYLWSSLLITFPAANAAIALTFAENVMQPGFPTCTKPSSGVRLLAACSIFLLTFVNGASVKWATRVQNIFTIVKIVALTVIIVTGLVLLCMGHTANFENAFESSSTDPGKIVYAFYSGLFSYSGWYTLNFLVEELKNPYQNLPRAIWISMPLVTFIYVMVNVAYFTVLSPAEIIASDAIAVTFAERVYGVGAVMMPIFVAFSAFGGLNGCIMSVSRLFFVAARQGQLPEMLAFIHVSKFTPMPAIMFEGAVSVLFLIADDVFKLINYVCFIEALGFLACTIALFMFRVKRPNVPRPIKVNLFIPIVFLCVCIFLAIYPIYAYPADSVVGLLICASAIPVYWFGVSWKSKPKSFTRFMAKVTHSTQKLTMSVGQEGPTDS